MTNTNQADVAEHLCARIIEACTEKRRLLLLPDSGSAPRTDGIRLGEQKGRARGYAEALALIAGDSDQADAILAAAAEYVEAMFVDDLPPELRMPYTTTHLRELRKLAGLETRGLPLDAYQVRCDVHNYTGAPIPAMA